jgi:uncharacterized protein (TIGR02453 family)
MSPFGGFPEQAVEFYSGLAADNNKAWFDSHKDDYERFVMEPAREFVYALGIRLKEISHRVIADPRVNKSIFRPYRDTRFSRDKSPFKTHLGIFFWEGTRPKMECSGYYFHLEPPIVMLATGIHRFQKEQMEVYREAVIDSTLGPELLQAVELVTALGIPVGGRHFKKLPRGYTAEGRSSEFLLHNGLFAVFQSEIPGEFFSESLLDYCFAYYERMNPIHQWLTKALDRQ